VAKKKDKYRLQALLTIKERLKNRAEIVLAKAINQLEKEKKKLKKLEEEKEKIIQKQKDIRREFHEKVCTGISQAKESHVFVNFVRKLKDDQADKEREILQQKEVIEDAEVQVQRARRQYVDAAKEHRIMEKHKELWKKKVMAEMNRIEEREMDELGHVVHQMRRVL